MKRWSEILTDTRVKKDIWTVQTAISAVFRFKREDRSNTRAARFHVWVRWSWTWVTFARAWNQPRKHPKKPDYVSNANLIWPPRKTGNCNWCVLCLWWTQIQVQLGHPNFTSIASLPKVKKKTTLAKYSPHNLSAHEGRRAHCFFVPSVLMEKLVKGKVTAIAMLISCSRLAAFQFRCCILPHVGPITSHSAQRDSSKCGSQRIQPWYPEF